MIERILIPVISMAGLGLVFGLGLAYVLKLFAIEIDPTVALVITRLPGANCGACGKAGCAGFAEALKKGETIPAGCVVANDEARQAIAEILGIEYNPKVKTVAVVHCNGGRNAKNKYEYKGIQSCKAASLLFGGYKTCSFGCLSLGDCVRKCPFGAIKMDDLDIPRVESNKCTACGICVKTCPKKLFTIVKLKDNYYVKCSSTDPAFVVKKVCRGGCIACKVCEKVTGGVFEIKDNLAGVRYERATAQTEWNKAIEMCPTKVIVKIT